MQFASGHTLLKFIQNFGCHAQYKVWDWAVGGSSLYAAYAVKEIRFLCWFFKRVNTIVTCTPFPYSISNSLPCKLSLSNALIWRPARSQRYPRHSYPHSYWHSSTHSCTNRNVIRRVCATCCSYRTMIEQLIYACMINIDRHISAVVNGGVQSNPKYISPQTEARNVYLIWVAIRFSFFGESMGAPRLKVTYPWLTLWFIHAQAVKEINWKQWRFKLMHILFISLFHI